MSALINQARSRVPRMAEAAVERARLTVVPRQPTPAARTPFVVLVSLMLVGGVVGLLLFNTSMQQASFTGTALAERAALLGAEQQSLRLELERLRNPQHLAERARDLGMVPPGAPAFLSLADGRVTGDPAPASAQDALRVVDLPTRKPADLDPPPRIVRVQPGAATGPERATEGRKVGQRRAGQEGSER